jgi:hypothetical protein
VRGRSPSRNRHSLKLASVIEAEVAAERPGELAFVPVMRGTHEGSEVPAASANRMKDSKSQRPPSLKPALSRSCFRRPRPHADFQSESETTGLAGRLLNPILRIVL